MTAVVVTGSGQICSATTRHAEHGSWFDPVPFLGARGWKYLSPATRYLLAAATVAIDAADLRPAELRGDLLGVAVGTNLAAQSVVARFDRTVRAAGADPLSPAEAPNFSVNIPASHISMRFGMRAFNLSLTNPVVAGLEAVLLLGSAIRAGRALAGVAGATEERPEDGWADDGACCFVLEQQGHAVARGAAPRAALAGGFSRFLPPDATPETWDRAIGGPLRTLLGRVDGPLPYAGPGGCGEFGARVDDYCRAVAANAGTPVTSRSGLGDDGRHLTVAPLLQLAGLLDGGLVVSVSPHGHVAALRLTGV